ncbi:FadR family transcriptional regulator [Cryobacterium sp. TMT1-3]|uniref:FadR family transcriptional regulator n=1 Tax=Cryobacterium luteum TaxID=1424661 RepID=A0A1H8ERD6_9MICO|nr:MULTISPECIES: FadR/GntR family transcriptional regulator [Cryobacterium]TFB85768.1 FadR family transcriptional regulator [Cryobacterium luteum]TFC31395.1 FadR family transcriptional regulator [Cryobacterium sp. TMT1-3]SEN21960.1 DNA-binding transcriptional regulator, FadR family [Cryobacterium luteum]
MTHKAAFTAVKTVKAYERVVEQIETAIGRRELRPGDRLPSERELMLTFEVSRSTIREALRVLESTGLVRSRPGDPRGPEVLQASPAILAKTVSRLVRLETVALSELVEFRIMLEGTACTLAAQHRTEAQLNEMRAAVDAMQQEVARGPVAFSRADVAFHVSVWAASQNQLLQICGEATRGALIDMVTDELDRAPDSQARMELSLAHDREILAAISAGDGASAGRLARSFIIEYYGDIISSQSRSALGGAPDDAVA